MGALDLIRETATQITGTGEVAKPAPASQTYSDYSP
jgi:hypothetical protein